MLTRENYEIEHIRELRSKYKKILGFWNESYMRLDCWRLLHR